MPFVSSTRYTHTVVRGPGSAPAARANACPITSEMRASSSRRRSASAVWRGVSKRRRSKSGVVVPHVALLSASDRCQGRMGAI